MTKHTVSKASLIYGGNVLIPGHQGGIIGAPFGNALIRMAFEGITPGASVITLTTASPVGERIELMQNVVFTERDYGSQLGPVLKLACAANETGKTATIRGMDGAGQFATKQVALGNITTVETPIGWSRLDTIELSATLAGNVTVTTSDKYSFPFAVHADPGQLDKVFVDAAEVASPSFTTARTAADDITGDDGRGILDLSGETLSDSTVILHMYIDRTSNDKALGLPTYTDSPTYNFVR